MVGVHDSRSRIRRLWARATSSLWFVPGLMIALAIGLAVLLIDADGWIPAETLAEAPRLFGAGAEGSRALLSAVAGSMIAVAGVVFSITLVALSLTASQYSSRVLRNFMRNRANQAVLGTFVSIFVYCLVVLRTVRGPEEGDRFIPSVAVLVGLLLGVVGVLVLVFFIHHISTSIQASQLLAMTFEDTLEAAERSMPADDDHRDDELAPVGSAEPRHPLVRATSTGYLQAVDLSALRVFAEEHDRVLWIEHEVGEFVIAGIPMVSIGGEPPSNPDHERLRATISIDADRSLTQDVPFGIRQLVDVALKGLSPGINDTTTAIMAIDYLTGLLQLLARRAMRSNVCDDDGRLRVVLPERGYPELLSVAFDQIRRSAAGNATVLGRLLWSAEVLDEVVIAPRRRAAVLELARAVEWSIRHTVPNPADQVALLRRADPIMRRLRAPPRRPPRAA